MLGSSYRRFLPQNRVHNYTFGNSRFFGLGLAPEDPNWGATINDGRKLLSIYPHPALVPSIALLSLVLGLNLLADGLREESLKD